MEAFVIEFTQMKDSINKLTDDLVSYKAENNVLRDRIDEMGEAMVELEKKYATLQEQVKTSESNDKGDSQSDSATNSLVKFDDKITSLDKKVDKNCQRIERSITRFKKKFTRGMTKVEDNSAKSQKLQKLLNVVHITVQSRKELKEEVDKNCQRCTAIERSITCVNKEVDKNCQRCTAIERSITCVNKEVNSMKNEISHLQPVAGAMSMSLTPPLPNPVSASLPLHRHPSKSAMSPAEAEKIRVLRNRSCFHVALDRTPLFYNNAIWIGGYTTVTIQCDYMDPVTGIYTVPLGGKYEFCVGSVTNNSITKIFLCMDRDHKRICVTEDRDHTKHYFFKTVAYDCLTNDKVWLEAVGIRNADKSLDGLFFKGKII